MSALRKSLPPKVRFSRGVPRTLKTMARQRAEQIESVEYGDDYNTDSGWAFEIRLREGWHNSEDHGTGSIIEPTAAEAIAKLPYIQRFPRTDGRDPSMS